MLPRNPATRYPAQHGGILLSAALMLFLASLLAAGGVLFVLWQDSQRSLPVLLNLLRGNAVVVATPQPSASDDPLVPRLVVAQELEKDRAELEKQLWMPMRSHYATTPQRLGDITVAPAADEEHTTRVTFELFSADNHEEHRFYFDRTGKARDGAFPKWEVAHLKITN